MKFSTTLVFLFLFISTYSQEYFNHRYEYGTQGWGDGASSIVSCSNGYIVDGLYQYFSPHCIGFCKLDFAGNKLFSTTICDDSVQYYSGQTGAILVLNSDSIIAIGSSETPANPLNHIQGVIYFLNGQLDSTGMKQFGEMVAPYDTDYIFFQLKLDPAGKLIITGEHYPYIGSQRTNILLIKTDTHGNLIWKKKYGMGLHYSGRSVICTSDGGYAVGGYGYGLPIPPDFTGDPVVLKTDSAGNQQWFKLFGGVWQDGDAKLCNTADGNILVGTTYCDSMVGGGGPAAGEPFRRINLIKLDNAGNIIWDKKFGRSELWNLLANITVDGNGDIIACGITTRRTPTLGDYAGWILKTNSNGDSLWYRQYVICGGGSSWNWLYDIVPAADGGYCSAGIVYPHSPDTGSADVWVLKVDSLGCETPSYCWVGMNPGPVLPAAGSFEFLPNPASDHTIVRFNPVEAVKPKEVTLYDLFGRPVRKHRLLQPMADFRLDLAGLPRGMYLVAVGWDNGIVTRGKLMVL